ncbi:MAG TPA: M13 family metallopeptidase [Ideonella sp.]|uniref:M13 family metallopeptidase n=1 Tax=Ideonella sp. TaxID=1929293 RepID=UPI002E360214|nr:M13 family metallopeptidase [Ideonella sp.]HEX5683497.1 M13 family metallopeptidase [Ideonella sp.]
MNTLKLSTLAVLVHLAAASFAAAPVAGLDRPGFDPAVRAQDDLFHAANGGWIKATEIPADKSEYGSFIQLRDLSDRRARAIVEELAKQQLKPGSVDQKVGTFYATYLDTDAIDKAGLGPIQPTLAEIDAIKTPKELATWLGKVQGRVEAPIQLYVMADFKNPTMNQALTWQGGLGLPDRDYYLKKEEERFIKARAAYETYLTTLATLAGLKDPADTAKRVMAIEYRIAEAHWDKVENRNPVKIYNPMTVAELAKAAPGLDWATFLQAANLGQVERLSVSQPSTATAVAKLYAEVPLADWKLYFKLRSLDEAGPVLPKAFRDARFAFRGTALTGAKEEKPRWQLGIAQVNGALGEAVGQLYVAKHFPPEYKARMQELVGNLLASYKESIDGLTWMTPATKAQAQAKLAKYMTKIGYPDQWRDYSKLEVRSGDALGNAQRASRFEWNRIAAKAGKPVDRAEWGMTPQTVNAYYNPSLNEIVFPAAILQPPFFDMAADDAVNYGAIGAVIGHEISHGFDDQGSQFDGEGVLRNWWTDDDRKAFEAVGSKLIAQYEGYEPLPGKKLNGKLTLGENIADLSGLQIAYKAYQRSLKGKPAPVIEGYTGTQRFFLGWSQAWREKVREERAMQLLTTDPHSPPEFRANGAAVNHDGFHEAFGTKAGDKMFKAPDERIRIW